MPKKVSTGVKSKMPEGKVNVVFVKNAGMWCKTFFKNGKQIQEWSVEKPTTEYPQE